MTATDLGSTTISGTPTVFPVASKHQPRDQVNDPDGLSVETGFVVPIDDPHNGWIIHCQDELSDGTESLTNKCVNAPLKFNCDNDGDLVAPWASLEVTTDTDLNCFNDVCWQYSGCIQPPSHRVSRKGHLRHRRLHRHQH